MIFERVAYQRARTLEVSEWGWRERLSPLARLLGMERQQVISFNADGLEIGRYRWWV